MSDVVRDRPVPDEGLLARARGGSESSFAQIVDPYRGELQAHCYRMLGSTQDAEDALQETLLRAWKGLDRFEGRSSLRSWLYRIATNACLDSIDRRPKRVLPIDYGPAADPHDGPGAPLVETVWMEPIADETLAIEDGLASPEARYEQRESVELAFVAAMQHLPANQRAALILKDVIGFSAQEIADSLETSTASVNSALQRARATVDDKLPERSQQETLRVMGDEKLNEVIDAYMKALQNDDVDGVVSLLTEDAAWSMPPAQAWFGPRSTVVHFLRLGPLNGEWRWKRMVTRANGQPAVAAYTWVPDEECYLPFALDVLTFDSQGQISDVTAFITRTTELDDPEDFKAWPHHPLDPGPRGRLFESFGLPARIDAD
ncbi:sigma-70 family RNA polymerase sigma factor [soil metagenome]